MWHVLAHEVGLQKKRGWENVSHGGLQIPESCIPNIQKKLVRLFADFSLAKIVWGYYVEPCLEEITQSDKVWQIKKYMSMDAPRSLDDALFHGDSGRQLNIKKSHETAFSPLTSRQSFHLNLLVLQYALSILLTQMLVQILKYLLA